MRAALPTSEAGWLKEKEMKESIRWDGAERAESQEVGNRTHRERFDISRRDLLIGSAAMVAALARPTAARGSC
jgi:hypothetical protein